MSRGGRPDLATSSSLHFITCSVLFIVGGLDRQVLELNKEAFAKLTSVPEELKKIEVVPKATHLFEERGKLEEVAFIVSKWLSRSALKMSQQEQTTTS